jgi:alpha-D-ribose 1-methylphosphonate 5-triphosphate synthase subunit PhnG
MSEIEDNPAQQARLSTLAKAPHDRLLALWADHGAVPDHAVLRVPEVGAVMVRGRAGATGAPFNLGEMTVTRCSVRLTSGAVGHGYVQGRGHDAARAAALIDALAEDGQAETLEAAVLAPLRQEAAAARAARAARAAATKVDFFTMARGED